MTNTKQLRCIECSICTSSVSMSLWYLRMYTKGCIAVRVVFLFICGASGSNRLMAVVVVYNMLLYVQC